MLLSSELNNICPSLSEGVEFHIFPDGGVIYGKSQKFRPNKKKNNWMELRGAFFVNKSAKDILKLCNGAYSVKEIIEKFCTFNNIKNPTDYKKYTLYTLSFLETSKEHGHIKFLQRKSSKTAPKFTGSEDYYMPINVTVELTDNCNLKCKHCYKGDSQKLKELSTPDMLSILKSLVENGVKGIELTGGEPLMHSDFFDILEFCGENFAVIAILTNGYFLNKEVAYKMKKYREKIVVSVSLDSSTSDFHDNFRGVNGSFERAKHAISCLSQYGIYVRVGMSVTPDNFYDIENTLLLSKGLGADSFTFSPVLPYGRGQSINWDVSTEERKRMLEYEKLIYERHKDFLTILTKESKEQMERDGNCGAGWKTFVLDAQGNVRPCVMMAKSSSSSFGNLNDQNPKDIFSNSLSWYFRELRAPSKQICGDCKFLPFCRNCPIRGVRIYKTKNKYCKWAKEYKIDEMIKKGVFAESSCYEDEKFCY